MFYNLLIPLIFYLVHGCEWCRKGLGSKKFKKNEFSCWGHSMPRYPKWMLRHWPPARWMLQHSFRMPRHPKVDRRHCLHASARTLQNYHLMLEKYFKMIPLGKVPYKSLVSVKNNKPTSLNQNLDNWKWFPNLCQNRGANTAVNFQKIITIFILIRIRWFKSLNCFLKGLVYGKNIIKIQIITHQTQKP